jgi:exodeoxyribonuclease VII large subunit
MASGDASPETTPRRSADDRPLSVSALASKIDGALKAGVPGRVRVIGQVSGFRDRTHWYFNLADEGAVIGAVVFASVARRAKVRLEDGLEVVASGRIDFYAPGGKVSLIVDKVEPVGAGAAELALRRLIEEVRALGWLDPERKRPLPTYPRRIGVVTSRTGAALQDVINTVARRCPGVGLLVVDARVQGENAATEVRRAIRGLGDRHEHLGVDAIIVTRGGGSAEDLAAFNDKELARAIVESPVPVVAAIGHETDTTLAELVADERCSTPTQAAMCLTPDRGALREQAASLASRLRRSIDERLRFERQRVRHAAGRPVLRDPRQITRVRREVVDALDRRLRQALRSAGAAERARLAAIRLRLERKRPGEVQARRQERVRALAGRLRRGIGVALTQEREAVDALERELNAVGPMSVLARGFSATLDAEGRLVRSVEQITPGQRLTTRLADGSFGSTVEGPEGPRHAPAPRPRRSRRRRGPADPSQMDLFDGAG